MSDAQIFAVAVYSAVSYPRDFRAILVPLAEVAHSNQYVSLLSVLQVLLVHTNAVSTPISEILAVAADLCSKHAPSDSDSGSLMPNLDSAGKSVELLASLVSKYDIDNDDSPMAIALSSESAAVEIADAFLADVQCRATALRFTLPSLHLFVRAKCLQALWYFPEISWFFDDFSALDGTAPYTSWLNGVIQPYNYYSLAYKLPNDICTPAGEFLLLKDHHSRFSYLVSPLGDSGLDVSAARFLASTALPLAVYYEYDFSELSVWAVENRTEDFRFWHDLLAVLTNYLTYEGKHLPLESYKTLVQDYLCMCLYFGLKNSKMTTVEYISAQDQILATLEYLREELDMVCPASGTLTENARNTAISESFSEFLSSDHPLITAIFDSDLKSVLADLHSIVATCCKLYPLNELTIKKYFELKSDPSNNWLQRETLSILSKVETSSYDKMISAIDDLKSSFISDASSAQEIDQVVFERLLQLDLYDDALLFLRNTSVLSENTFPLAYERFWELFNNATNLDDRIGKLKLAKNCLETMVHLAETEQQQFQCGRIRHLFRAIQNLKNFKLVLLRDQPITPKHIIEKLTLMTSEDKFPPISLIAIILEQNPKSYLAYEKLSKVVGDLAIYLDLDLGEISFPKVQTACVESALIDGNFNYAYKHSKELLTYYVDRGETEELSDIWLMFYQVGKYILAEWFNDYDEKVQKDKISVLYRQREVLSLAIKHSTPHKGSVDNTRLLVGQFKHINSEIQKWFEDAELHRSDHLKRAVKTTQKLQENISGIINEANLSKKQASEKLTNLFTSGLGWAIGATDRTTRPA